jgi:hypothetical protein
MKVKIAIRKRAQLLIAIQFTNIRKSGTNSQNIYNSKRERRPHSRESERESQRMGELMG